MNLRSFRPFAICLAAFAAVFGPALCAEPAAAQQTYRNIVNQKFHTVGNGPQSAYIVDVADPNDVDSVRRAVTTRMAAVNQARLPDLQREVAFLRKHRLLKLNQSIPLVDTVIIRHNGVLMLPDPKILTRGGGPNSLKFAINTDSTTSYFFDLTNATTAAAVTDLSSLVNNLLYPTLQTILGAPGWSGTVTILNKDDNPTLNSGIIGVTVVINVVNNVPTVTIDLPSAFAVQGLSQDEVLGMAQAMAQAFHGPLAIGYDAWEKGMSRAAAVVAAQSLQNTIQTNFAGTIVDPAAGFYYTPYYDLLNQPALGNNTFLPPTTSGAALSGLGGMIVPRLQTSSSAWLKCYIENTNFFSAFNTAYYKAYAADPTVANNVNALGALAAAAVPSVEGQAFANWFQQQYIFDTSVTTGPKEYVYPIPTPPDTTHADDGVALVILYYQTTSTGDETDLSGTAAPTYLASSYATGPSSIARLTLSGGDPTVPIVAGQGETGPYFDGIGNPQRIIIDIPVDSNYQRLYYPAQESTSGTASSLVYNDFYGVFVGSDTGTLQVSFSGGNGNPITKIIVANGAFGAVGPSGTVPNGLTKATLTYTPGSGGAPIVYYRNVFERQELANPNLTGVQNIFVLSAPTAVSTLTNTFQPYPQLISLPIQPLNPDLAAVFGIPPASTLLAQYRQNANGTPDDYLRYPSLPLYQPGYGLWTDFQGALNGVVITGQRTDNAPVVEVGLQYGWNMIGDPYDTDVSILTDGTTGYGNSGYMGGVTISDQSGDVYDLADAVTNNLVAAGVFGYDGVTITDTTATNSYIDITGTTTAPFATNTLEPWKGYWILVTATQGVTLSYVNPNPTTRAVLGPHLSGKGKSVKSTTKPTSDSGAWRLPLMVGTGNGRAASAQIGQASHGSDSYVSSLDAALPPLFTRAATLRLRFPHPEWNANTGGSDFLSDIRPTNSSSTWNVTVDLPPTQQAYTLSWGATARLPRGTSLTLTDKTTGATQLMNTTASYAFTPGKNETSRNFVITVQPHALSYIAVTNLRIDTPLVPAGRALTSATISYEATGVAETSIQIRSSTGRVIRHLVTGRATTSGVNQAIWDLRDDSGRVLSTGTFLVEVQARTADNRQTRAIAPYTLIR